MQIELWIPGKAKPAGSKRGFAHKLSGRYTGRVILTDDCKTSRSWKTAISYSAKAIYRGKPLQGPVEARFTFYRARPQDHYGKGRNEDTLKADAPAWPITKPDVLKLTRAAEDALTGIAYEDDAQIVRELITKEFVVVKGGFEGVHIVITEIQ